MINIAVCENNDADAIKIRCCIEYYFTNHPATYNVDLYTSGEAFLLNTSCKKYDIAFLTATSQGIDGIELARHLRRINSAILLIFVSDSHKQVFRSFEVEPLTYLLKPIIYENLYIVMQHAARKLLATPEQSFAFSFGNTLYVVPLSEIVYFESRLRIINIQTLRERYQFYGKLSEIERRLHNKSFVRCHQSYIINMQHILRVDNTSILTKTNETINISRGKSQLVKKQLVEYIGSIL